MYQPKTQIFYYVPAKNANILLRNIYGLTTRPLVMVNDFILVYKNYYSFVYYSLAQLFRAIYSQASKNASIGVYI